MTKEAISHTKPTETSIDAIFDSLEFPKGTTPNGDKWINVTATDENQITNQTIVNLVKLLQSGVKVRTQGELTRRLRDAYQKAEAAKDAEADEEKETPTTDSREVVASKAQEERESNNSRKYKCECRITKTLSFEVIKQRRD